MSDSEKKAKANTSPPAPPSPPASGDAKETTKNATAPSPSSTPSPPPNDTSKSNKKPPPSPEKKTPDASPPPSPPEKKTPPPPSTPSTPSKSTPSTSQPPTPQTAKQSPPAPAQTRSPAQQQSPPAPNSNSKESSPSSSSPSSSSSSSSKSPSDDSPSPPSPSGSSKNSTKTNPTPPPPSTGTSQPSSSSNSTSSSPSPVSSPVLVNISNTQSSPSSSPQALVLPNGTPSTSNSPNSNSNDGSSGSGDSNNDTSSSNNNTDTNNKHNVSGSAKHLSSDGLIAVAVVGVLVVAFIILFFYMRQKKKNQQSSKSNANYNTPSPDKFTVTSDAHVGQSPGGHDTVYYNSQIHGQQTNIANSPHRGLDSDIMTGSKTFFTYEELMEMTGGFARQNVIGEGGFGCVYKGWMSDGKLVAVKQLKAGSGQGEREFRAEVEIISRVHHRHLVSLVGYSVAENQRLLIYEFVPNNTLEHHLHGNHYFVLPAPKTNPVRLESDVWEFVVQKAKDLPVLEWAKRVKIALGAAKGLAYLHEDCHPKIIHRDIKSANILLEDNFEAKVADFGLARLNDTAQSHVSTRVMGTFGYLAPEYASSGKLTDRSDVYSFGVVLLELLTGRKPIDSTRPLGDENLVEWARPLLIRALESGDYGEIIDPRLEKRYVESEMIRMVEAAAACVRHSATKRPRMALLARALDFEGDPDLSNGVKYGDSTAYDSAKYSEEISIFRQMALGSTDNSSEYDMYSREYGSETQSGLQNSWESQHSLGDYTSDELETRALKPDSEYRRASGKYNNTDSFR